MKSILLLCALSMLSAEIFASEYITYGAISNHFNTDSTYDHNETHYGLGYEKRDINNSVGAGIFKNSMNGIVLSGFKTFDWQVLPYARFQLGLAGGIYTAQKKASIFIMPFPSITFDKNNHSISVIYSQDVVENSDNVDVVILQFKYRI